MELTTREAVLIMSALNAYAESCDFDAMDEHPNAAWLTEQRDIARDLYERVAKHPATDQ
ncbi:MAG: hypothetical protein JWO22_2137 [Frankiales bacterium]|nr:hypothetical protein [Frankiales bacterium]